MAWTKGVCTVCGCNGSGDYCLVVPCGNGDTFLLCEECMDLIQDAREKDWDETAKHIQEAVGKSFSGN